MPKKRGDKRSSEDLGGALRAAEQVCAGAVTGNPVRWKGAVARLMKGYKGPPQSVLCELTDEDGRVERIWWTTTPLFNHLTTKASALKSRAFNTTSEVEHLKRIGVEDARQVVLLTALCQPDFDPSCVGLPVWLWDAGPEALDDRRAARSILTAVPLPDFYPGIDNAWFRLVTFAMRLLDKKSPGWRKKKSRNRGNGRKTKSLFTPSNGTGSSIFDIADPISWLPTKIPESQRRMMSVYQSGVQDRRMLQNPRVLLSFTTLIDWFEAHVKQLSSLFSVIESEPRITAEQRLRLKLNLSNQWQEAILPYVCAIQAYLDKVVAERGSTAIAGTADAVIRDLVGVTITADEHELPVGEALRIARRLVLAHFSQRMPMGRLHARRDAEGTVHAWDWEWHGSQEATGPAGQSLRLNDASRTVEIKGKTRALTEEQFACLKEIVKAGGQYVRGTDIKLAHPEIARPDRVLGRLPGDVRSLIDGKKGAGGGFRIDPADLA